MRSDYEPKARIEAEPDGRNCYLHKFKLYETQSKFYMIGRNKNRTLWRVLKIDRSNPSELNIHEDSTTYSKRECIELLNRIHERNRSTGGLNFVTNCYGVVGFVKFLGPYYMLLITKRQQIGTICGHEVYAVSKSEMIALPYSTVKSNMDYSKDENRYKKLLCTVDLTKDFFFSYSYHVMRSLQKNLCDDKTGQVLYETMFVWNEFLTRGIRNHLKNTLWTVALVFGFFQQAKFSLSGKNFKLTLIARRSRHYAGTRYLKRGVNEKGRVANDVETEQIVSEDVPEGCLAQISSVVQNRGSIPLFWSQEASWLNVKPDIILQKNQNYEATQLHFENLVKRYGNPIIILNLIKKIESEKKPRESLLREAFTKAIEFINNDLPKENRLKFLHFDLAKHSKSKATNVLELLGEVAAYALNCTGFFYCQITSALRLEGSVEWPFLEKDTMAWSLQNHYNSNSGNAEVSQTGVREDNVNINKNCLVRPPVIQKGVLRTNCIDCLDRTNVAQYAYGLAALGHQLHALGFLDVPKVDLDAPLANDLMSIYEKMGDTLALQYGGSAAHNKIFSEIRGQWKAATRSQEFFKSIQRYYSNTYMDAQKQDAINVFLGYFQPQQGKPALWEMDSDQHYKVRTFTPTEKFAWVKKRSLSVGNILYENKIHVPSTTVGQKELPHLALPKSVFQERAYTRLSGPTMNFSTCESDISNSRYSPSIAGRQFFEDMQRDRCLGYNLIYLNAPGGGDSFNSSNFLDTDWISSSGNSFEEQIHYRSSFTNSSIASLSSENVVNNLNVETTTPIKDRYTIKGSEETGEILLCDACNPNSNVVEEFSDKFIRWVVHGGTLCH